jgi:hypothetical protein
MRSLQAIVIEPLIMAGVSGCVGISQIGGKRVYCV